jgi:hypothetical protein
MFFNAASADDLNFLSFSALLYLRVKKVEAVLLLQQLLLQLLEQLDLNLVWTQM